MWILREGEEAQAKHLWASGGQQLETKKLTAPPDSRTTEHPRHPSLLLKPVLVSASSSEHQRPGLLVWARKTIASVDWPFDLCLYASPQRLTNCLSSDGGREGVG